MTEHVTVCPSSRRCLHMGAQTCLGTVTLCHDRSYGADVTQMAGTISKQVDNLLYGSRQFTHGCLEKHVALQLSYAMVLAPASTFRR
jgi:hypothetical protein